MSLISIAEKKYICDGVLQDIRNDGRRNNQFRFYFIILYYCRNIEIETNLLQQSHGSSRVRFTNGGTDVVTSIKAEVQPITDGFKLENMIEASVVFTASASKDYHTRIVKTEGDLLAQSIEEYYFCCYLICSILKSTGAMDLKELVIVNKMFCWKIYVDVEVYDDSGNVFDLIMLSVLVALRTTRLPITTAIRDLNQNEKEFDIDQDPTHFRRLSCMGIPIAISIYTVCFVYDCYVDQRYCIHRCI